jgi:hypothetical protein
MSNVNKNNLNNFRYGGIFLLLLGGVIFYFYWTAVAANAHYNYEWKNGNRSSTAVNLPGDNRKPGGNKMNNLTLS